MPGSTGLPETPPPVPSPRGLARSLCDHVTCLLGHQEPLPSPEPTTPGSSFLTLHQLTFQPLLSPSGPRRLPEPRDAPASPLKGARHYRHSGPGLGFPRRSPPFSHAQDVPHSPGSLHCPMALQLGNTGPALRLHPAPAWLRPGLLRGPALAWLRPGLLHGPAPAWLRPGLLHGPAPAWEPDRVHASLPSVGDLCPVGAVAHLNSACRLSRLCPHPRDTTAVTLTTARAFHRSWRRVLTSSSQARA